MFILYNVKLAWKRNTIS